MDELEILVSKLAHRGQRGFVPVALLDQEDPPLELELPGAWPGEQHRVTVSARSRHHARAYGRSREIRLASPDRRAAACAQHPSQGGKCQACPFMPFGADAVFDAKLRAIREAYDLPLRVQPRADAAEFGYRHAAKRIAAPSREGLLLGGPVRPDKGDRRTGPKVASMRGCQVDHPDLRELFDRLERLARKLRIEAALAPGKSPCGLRFVWAKRLSQGLVVTLGWDAQAIEDARRRTQELAGALTADWPPGPQGSPPIRFALALHRGEHNALRRPETLEWSEATPAPSLPAELAAELGPLDFLQPNPERAAKAYAAMCRGPGGEDLGGTLAIDLYAGRGAITRALRGRYEKVLSCELDEAAAKALGFSPQRAQDMLHEVLRAGLRPDLITANPPRSGLGEATAPLVELRAPRLHLMSCHPQSLGRDLASLSEAYDLVGVDAFDTLPHTHHIELVAHLQARPKPRP